MNKEPIYTFTITDTFSEGWTNIYTHVRQILQTEKEEQGWPDVIEFSVRKLSDNRYEVNVYATGVPDEI